MVTSRADHTLAILREAKNPVIASSVCGKSIIRECKIDEKQANNNETTKHRSGARVGVGMLMVLWFYGYGLRFYGFMILSWFYDFMVSWFMFYGFL